MPAPILSPGDPFAPLATFRALLNLDTSADWLRCLAWLLAAFRPDGPHPVLILQGPSASGKSLAARLLRSIVEPHTAPLAPPPHSVQDLAALARRQWILAFDHVSTLNPNVSDSLCRLSSGLGIALQPELRTRGDEPPTQTCKNPVLLTVTEHWTCPPDLAARALVVNCPPIPLDRHRPEAALVNDFHDALPAIVGALCSVLSAALAGAAELNRPSSGTHCADALAWAIAAAPALGCTPQELKDAFALPPAPAPGPIVAGIRQLLDREGTWTGTASELAALVAPSVAPQALSRHLKNGVLPEGIAIKFCRHRQGIRTIELVRQIAAPLPHPTGDDMPPQIPSPPAPSVPQPPADQPLTPAATIGRHTRRHRHRETFSTRPVAAAPCLRLRWFEMSRNRALAALVCLPVLAAAQAQSIDTALQRLYNFDFRGAHEILDRLIAAAPQDPLPVAFRASAYLFYELDRLQVLESEFLISDQKIVEKKKPLSPDPEVRKRFQQALEETQRLGDAALKADPNDRNALFALCIAQGVTTDYMALIERKQMSSLAPAKRSNNYAQRLLKLDPKFYDAYLTAGFSEYMIGSLPFFIKWFVRFDNVSGSKERGVQNLQLTAREGLYFRPFAKILLSIVALREKRPQDAQKLLAELAHDYPANPLFRKELAKLNAN